jgi:hypothetical protein
VLAAYSGTMLAQDAEWQSGALGELLVDTRWGGRASVGGGYAAPSTIRGEGADAVITRTPITARVGFGWGAGVTRLGVESGVVADAWHRTTAVRSPELRPTGERTHFRVGGTLGVRLELFVSARVGLSLLAEALWFPTPLHFDVQPPEGEAPLSTWAVRPQVSVGATFDLTPRVDGG